MIEEVAEKSANLIVKKVLKWGALLIGFAATGIVLAKVLSSEDDDIYVLQETGEVVEDEPS